MIHAKWNGDGGYVPLHAWPGGYKTPKEKEKEKEEEKKEFFKEEEFKV